MYLLVFWMVPRPGIEPGLPKKQDFKSCVSTISTIWAEWQENSLARGYYAIIPFFLKVLNPAADTLILYTRPVSGSFIFL